MCRRAGRRRRRSSRRRANGAPSNEHSKVAAGDVGDEGEAAAAARAAGLTGPTDSVLIASDEGGLADALRCRAIGPWPGPARSRREGRRSPGRPSTRSRRRGRRVPPAASNVNLRCRRGSTPLQGGHSSGPWSLEPICGQRAEACPCRRRPCSSTMSVPPSQVSDRELARGGRLERVPDRGAAVGAVGDVTGTCPSGEPGRVGLARLGGRVDVRARRSPAPAASGVAAAKASLAAARRPARRRVPAAIRAATISAARTPQQAVHS